MTPAPPPPTDDRVDVNDLLNEPAAESEGLDPDSVDADFEQELEDLFSDDLEEQTPPADDDDGPVVLDDVVAEDGQDDGVDDDLLVLDDVADDDLIILDDVVAEDGEAADADEAAGELDDIADVESLVDDIAEENVIEDDLEVEEDDAIELDDLVEEAGDSGEEDIMDLDELIEEEGGPEEADELDQEEISIEPEDLMDVALAEETEPEVPVEEAVADEEIESLMDEPEPEAEPVSEPQVVMGNVFESEAGEAASPEEADSELTGLDELEVGDIEDVDSLLDNVEVDVSDVVDAEADLDAENLDMDDLDGSMEEVLTAESMPPDAGMDLSSDVDMDQLLEEARTEAGEASLAGLQSTVHTLEARVEELERRLRDEIAQMVPAEAARIIREEIAALAAELDD